MANTQTSNLFSQKELIESYDWDYLIVLDACRFDSFSDLCLISGKLKSVFSPAFKDNSAPTSTWYKEIFQNKYDDIVHVSSHPRVNSKIEVEGFEGSKHFHKVIDLWDFGWNKKYGTVLPESVTSNAIKILKNFPKKRLILHYMQPHTPYLSLEPPSTKKKKEPKSRDSFLRKIRNSTVSTARRYLGDMKAVRIMDFFGIPPLSPQDDALRNVGEEGVQKAYKENLKRALKSVKNFLDKIDGKTVITSDHGELLGEEGMYGHDFEEERKELVKVPWLEVGDIN